MMLEAIRTTLLGFYSRNLFDKLVVYFLITQLVIKVYFGLIKMEDPYYSPRFPQYLFFSLLLLDYLICYKEIFRLKITINYISLFLLFFIFIIIQGIFVGILNGNHPFEIFNDTVPLVLLILNAFRMQSLNAPKQSIDFEYLLRVTTAYCALICTVGLAARFLGTPIPAGPSIITTAVFVALIVSSILCKRPLKWHHYLVGLLLVGSSYQDMNRSTMFFLLFGTLLVLSVGFFRNPLKAIGGTMSIFAVLIMVIMTLPKDSKLYVRIDGLKNLDFSASSGSVGERSEEYRRITRKLDQQGLSSVWLGLGHGGVYNMKTTHEFVKGYGHAHYSWALFKLRYGQVGFIYLTLMTAVLIWQIIRHWTTSIPENLLIALLCVQSMIYLLTYVNFVFLTSGLLFFYALTRTPPTQSLEPQGLQKTENR